MLCCSTKQAWLRCRYTQAVLEVISWVNLGAGGTCQETSEATVGKSVRGGDHQRQWGLKIKSADFTWVSVPLSLWVVLYSLQFLAVWEPCLNFHRGGKEKLLNGKVTPTMPHYVRGERWVLWWHWWWRLSFLELPVMDQSLCQSLHMYYHLIQTPKQSSKMHINFLSPVRKLCSKKSGNF